MSNIKYWWVKKILLLPLALAIAVPFSLLSQLLPVSAASTSYSKMSIDQQITAYQYYYQLFQQNACQVKTDIKDGDISNYAFLGAPNFFGVASSKEIYVGYVAHPSASNLSCLSPSTIKLAAQAFNIQTSDPAELLCSLGYTQVMSNSPNNETSCFKSNSSLGSSTEFKVGSATDIANHLKNTFFGGSAPTFTNAMAYYQSMQDFITGCNASVVKSGNYSSNTISIPTIGSDGSIANQSYTYQDGNGNQFAAPGDIGSNSGSYTTSNGQSNCNAMGLALSQMSSKYPTAYQQYLYTQLCDKQYSDAGEAAACIAGTMNKNNINYCTNAYVNNTGTGASTDATKRRLACYAGQGNQGEDACVTQDGYTSVSDLKACIAGAQNSSDPNYCSLNFNPNRQSVAACEMGQKTPASNGLPPLKAPALASQNSNTGTTPSTCIISGIGWLICPVVTFLAGVANVAYGFLANNFLTVSPSLIDGSSPTFQAWSAFRNFADIILVIGFMIIIYSQITGIGLSNYGVKKLLPRLIMVAIFINVSFLICQIAVDISDILGFSLKDFISNIAKVSSNIADPSNWSTGNGIVGVAGSILAGGTAAGVAVAASGGVTLAFVSLIGVLVAGLITLLMIFFILIIRQMLIVLLIVIAPVAFAAYLLPNTQQWFTKWRKLFVDILLVFPIIGLIYGASSLASKIVSSTYASTDNLLGQVVAMGVLILPLLLVPVILKASLSGLGTLGAKITGTSGKLSEGLRRKGRESNFMKYQQDRVADRAARVATGNYRGKGGLLNPRNIRSRFNARMNNNQAFNTATSGFGASRFLASQAQDRKDMKDAIEMFNNDDYLIEAWGATGGDLTKAKNWVASNGTRLNEAQLQQIGRMRAAGHHLKPSSHLAAVAAMSESGKGNTEAIASAVGNAKSAGASQTEVDGAWQAALASYRKAGRGDIVGEMEAQIAANGGLTPDKNNLRATIAQLNLAREKGWKQVSPSTVHREGLKPGTEGLASYERFLNADKENTRQALVGFDHMEGRAKAAAQTSILTAAQSHESAATGVPSTITSIQDAKDYFGIK